MTLVDLQKYLAERPDGAFPDDIARDLVVERINLMKHLRKLLDRGIVVQVGASKHQTQALWRLAENPPEPTGPRNVPLRAPFTNFGGAANLALMSAACLDRIRAGLTPHWAQDIVGEVAA